MHYNVDFEVCTLGMLLLVLANLPLHNMVQTFSNRLFLTLTVCGVFDILLDIGSAVTMTNLDIYPMWVVWLFWLGFYTFQVLMPFLLYVYVLSLSGTLRRRRAAPVLCGLFFPAIMWRLVYTNPVLELISRFDANGYYHHGPLYFATHCYALSYLILSMVLTVRHRRSIPRRHVRAIGEFVAICLSMVVMQMLFDRVLLTGVGIGASLIVFLLTVNHPMNQVDALTGAFDSEALKAVLREARRNSVTALPVLLALDNLKRVNLVFGLEAGNRVLQECARQLTALAGSENVFRFLGDRFVVVCHSEEEYSATLAKVRRMFDEPWEVQHSQVHLTACICGVPKTDGERTTDELLDFMDYLMSRAKGSGAGSFLEENPQITAEFLRHKEIEAYLYRAIQQNLFEVYFQPIYSVKENTFVSAEALVRLRHPQYGMLSPAEFIPIAERSGEISHMEMAIFEKLCQFLQQNAPVREVMRSIKFNISPASFLSARPAKVILEQIGRFGLDANIFQFEITETTATVYDSEIMEWARRIREAGAGLCMDDFGSGYANLGAVMRLPFDVVKIDRSMLLEADRDPQGAVLYAKLVDALSSLGYQIVAEGAETEKEVDFLRKMPIDGIQGFYYAKPMPAEEFSRLAQSLKNAGADA